MARRRSTPSSTTSALALPPYLDVAPRHGTLRNFNNPTYGPRLAKVHRLLTKKNPMPWQQYVYDVLGEVDPRTGFRVYREGYLTTMRQVGKTTNVRTFKAHRAIDCTEPQTILFAAQDGIEAKKKWLEHAKLLKATPLASKLAGPDQPTTSNGKEDLVWFNGSSERPISSRVSSGHGDTLDLGVVTEAFALVDDRYENTMIPAMNTRPDAQFFAESTEGTALSLYWNERVDEHRARLEADPLAPSRIAFFDWSFSEDDDPALEETWHRRIPSLGHILRVEEIQFAFDRATTPAKMRQFMRGFGNVRDLGGAADEGIFAEDDWEDTSDDQSQLVGERAFALDIAPDRTWSAIGWAGVNQFGEEHDELIAFDRGTHWVLDELTRRMTANGASRVTIVAKTQAALMETEIRKAGFEVRLLDRAEWAAACARYSDGIVNHTRRHRMNGQAPLEAAVAAATWTGGQQRVFTSSDDTVTIAPLVAVAAAAEGYRLRAEPVNVLDTIA